MLCVYYKGSEGIPGHGSSFRSLTVSFAIASNSIALEFKVGYAYALTTVQNNC